MALDIDDDIVQSIYQAAAGLIPWNRPLGGLFRELQVRCMQLVFVDRRAGTLLASEQPAELFDPDAVQGTLEHIREWARVDPHIGAVAQLPIGSVYDSERALAPQTFAAHPFYREHWAAYQNRGLLAAKVAEDQERAGLLGVIRSWWHPAFTEEEGQLFGRYAGHLRVALRISNYVESLRTDAIAGRSLMEAANNPMLVLDSSRRIMEANKAATALLGEGSTLFDDHGLLASRPAANMQSLITAFEMVTPERADDKSGRDRAAVRLAQPGRSPLLCSMWRLYPENTMAAFGRVPAVLFSVANSSAIDTPDPIFLTSFFQLTPAEARVAIALRPGMRLAQVAAERHVSIETIRSQVRSIYQKTQTSNRSELQELLRRLARP